MTLLFEAWLKNEFEEVPPGLSALIGLPTFRIAGCVVGNDISVAGVWLQLLIASTSFSVLVNVNKFDIFPETFIMGTKTLMLRQSLMSALVLNVGISMSSVGYADATVATTPRVSFCAPGSVFRPPRCQVVRAT